jgi:hypothetical protein
VTRYSLPSQGYGRDVDVYLRPTGVAGQQTLEGVIYADSSGAPGSLLATTSTLAYLSTAQPGWYALKLPRQPTAQNPSGLLLLAPGDYWIGILTGGDAGVAAVSYDAVTAGLAYNTNPFSAGPSDPFGPISTRDERVSMYLTYYAPPF